MYEVEESGIWKGVFYSFLILTKSDARVGIDLILTAPSLSSENAPLLLSSFILRLFAKLEFFPQMWRKVPSSNDIPTYCIIFIEFHVCSTISFLR